MDPIDEREDSKVFDQLDRPGLRVRRRGVIAPHRGGAEQEQPGREKKHPAHGGLH
jgi:hypothetical protein